MSARGVVSIDSHTISKLRNVWASQIESNARAAHPLLSLWLILQHDVIWHETTTHNTTKQDSIRYGYWLWRLPVEISKNIVTGSKAYLLYTPLSSPHGSAIFIQLTPSEKLTHRALMFLFIMESWMQKSMISLFLWVFVHVSHHRYHS